MIGQTLALRCAVSTLLFYTVFSSPLLFKGENDILPRGFGLEPEVYMTATELITSKGYPCENYYVTTKDGYIMNVLRIPHGRNPSKPTNETRPVVVLQHGLEGSCTNWLVNLANESLAYLLADAGADVWLGNSRGNTYSINHTHLDPKGEEFWKFSWDEMAKYDLPALIDFARNISDVDQVYYAGHSQGTTIGFIGFQDPELAAKIKLFFALAPVARVGNAGAMFRLISPLANAFFDIFGHKTFFVEPDLLHYLTAGLCNSPVVAICDSVIFAIGGWDSKSMNNSRVPVYVAHSPAGTSVQNMLHWAQEVNSKEFQKYDYGSATENMKHYNQTTPPLYDPKKVKVPVAIFRAGKDILADPKDVAWLMPQLNVVKDVFVEHYEHMDLIWAYDTPKYIYNDILDLIFPKN